MKPTLDNEIEDGDGTKGRLAAYFNEYKDHHEK